MVIDVPVCCEMTAGIHRVSCLEWPHLHVGGVPYGSVCRKSEHIAVFQIWFCSQSFVAYKFNIVVINSRSVFCGGGSYSPPLKTGYLWGQSSWYFIPQYKDLSQLTTPPPHLLFPDISSLRRTKTMGCISPVCELCCLMGPILSVFLKIKETSSNTWSLRAIFFPRSRMWPAIQLYTHTHISTETYLNGCSQWSNGQICF